MSTEQRAGELYFVQAFERTRKGRIVPGAHQPACGALQAVRLAAQKAERNAGAIVYLRGATDAQPEVVGVFGDIPREAIDALDNQ